MLIFLRTIWNLAFYVHLRRGNETLTSNICINDEKYWHNLPPPSLLSSDHTWQETLTWPGVLGLQLIP